MKLWDLIKPNKKDIFQEYADNMQPLAPAQPLEAIQVQMGNNGGVDFAPVQESMQVVQTPKKRGLTLAERVLGQQMTPTDNIGIGNGQPITTKDEITGEEVTYSPERTSTISSNPRIGGIFPDIAAGARENYATGFAAPNLFDNQTTDGRRKGFAYRLGEGLGTAGRFLQSPLGRGLLMAGIVGATGGSGLEALAYGGQAGVLNQNLRNADNLYRQQLKDNYGYTDEQLNARKGYIDPTTFNNLTKSQNSAMNLVLRQQTTQSMNRLRELQIEKQRIINSNLPEMEKAKLIKANAEAAHAEEMQLAKIQYYQNSAALGWGNLGLKIDKFNYDKTKDEKEAENEQKVIDSLTGGTTPPGPKNDGWAF